MDRLSFHGPGLVRKNINGGGSRICMRLVSASSRDEYSMKVTDLTKTFNVRFPGLGAIRNSY